MHFFNITYVKYKYITRSLELTLCSANRLILKAVIICYSVVFHYGGVQTQGKLESLYLIEMLSSVVRRQHEKEKQLV